MRRSFTHSRPIIFANRATVVTSVYEGFSGSAQAALLRVLEIRMLRRTGGAKEISVQVWLIAGKLAFCTRS